MQHAVSGGTCRPVKHAGFVRICLIFCFVARHLHVHVSRSYIRFHPDPQHPPQQAPAQQAATAHGGYMPDPCSVMCSSPMAKLGSPNLHYCESAASPRSNRPRSAGSVCQVGSRWAPEQQQQQQVTRRPESPLRGSGNLHPWHREQLKGQAAFPQQQQQQQQVTRRPESPLRGSGNLHPWHREQLKGQAAFPQQQQQQSVRSSAGVPTPLAQQQDQGADAVHAVGALLSNGGQHSAAAAGGQSSRPQSPRRAQDAASGATLAAETAADNEGTQQQQNEHVDDEVLLYGELMSALRRGGGSLRAEAILEQLLQELGAARAVLSSERGDGRNTRARLDALEEQHSGCADSKRMLQVGWCLTPSTELAGGVNTRAVPGI
jgi:hypothetical protein